MWDVSSVWDISVESSMGISKMCVWMCVDEECIKCLCVYVIQGCVCVCMAGHSCVHGCCEWACAGLYVSVGV